MTKLARKIRIYTASKLAQAQRWRDLPIEWPEVEVTSRWPFLHSGHLDESPYLSKTFWATDLADLQACDVVLVYAEGKEKLRGALVEAGMGIALGKQVIVVGDCPDYGSWQYAAAVHRVKTLAQARVLLLAMAMHL